MPGFSDYEKYDGLGLAELIRKKEVTALELCEEAFQRMDRINPKINAVIYRMEDAARTAAKGPIPQGPFSGVPFLCKDLVSAIAGVPMTKGSKACRNYVPTQDSEMARRYKASGLIVLGKTNTPEFGLMGITEPELHGPTRNPWNLDRTPGGSSGGSGAAVAAGIVPLASGGDGGGSIRIPSSCCGLFGLKPTRGRNPLGPESGEVWQGAEVEGVITRSVRDTAAMLDATHGADPGAPCLLPAPERPFLEYAGLDPKPLKIGYTVSSPLKAQVDHSCVQAVQSAAKLLESLGHTVEEASPEIDGESVARCYFMLYFGEVAADIEELKSVVGRPLNHHDTEETTWALNLLGKAFSAGDFVLARRQWNTFSRQMAKFNEKYDLYMTPTIASLPPRIGEAKQKPSEEFLLKIINSLNLGGILKASGLADVMATKSLIKMPFTQLANFTGQPAMSVPLHWSKEGLPCGVQFIGRFAEESLLLQLGGQLERAAPWFDKRPKI
ncbi:MAG TPA: amidase [Smithellaceae bacterium]|nr:amidase [Smithellaceae bacterium]HOG81220.1 amidase [Smithellaceae bacterium]HOQ41179.1 amidase [Smithellaceae bacterium]HPL65513.1 amidase [Smithellaceae bacterium]